jgi:hypothetical protein
MSCEKEMKDKNYLAVLRKKKKGYEGQSKVWEKAMDGRDDVEL